MRKRWVIAVLLIAVVVAPLWWGVHRHFVIEDKVLVGSAHQHLLRVLDELRTEETAGHWPTLAVVRQQLNDPAVMARVHLSSLFTTQDLFYVATPPKVGGDAVILGGHLGNRYFLVRANRVVQDVDEREFLSAKLVPLGADVRKSQP